MESGKEILGIFSVLLVGVGYAPYLLSIIRHVTKPHIFSWIVWGTVDAIAFAAQWSKGAGPGAWSVACTSLVSFVIVALAIRRGEKDIRPTDKIAFVLALLAIVLWAATDNPLWAVILAAAIDVLACYPTLRKAFLKPHEEAIFVYGIAALRMIIILPAIAHYSPTTLIYPITLIFTNSTIPLAVLWRRRSLAALKLKPVE